ncbi:MAG: ribonuclease P protein component [Firmicutes bacterium]|nr:ribonuclease P protein component [Bacillota bacterium]
MKTNKLTTLSKQKQISKVFEEGSSYSNRFFVVRALPNGGDGPRFVFAVGKRYGKAVERNRIKRRAREILRQNLDIIPTGYDYAIIPRLPCQTGEFAELETHLLQALAGAASRKGNQQ